MACPQCGWAAAERDRFCGGCGTPLAQVCRRCGGQLDAGVTFCTGCGNPVAAEPDLRGAAGTTPGTARPAPPAPPGVTTEDRRRVSVLFLDLVGFTPYAERTDPEVVRRLQSSFYATARRVVAQHGGVVEKYIGDAVMALFGAPVATETDALRCVRAGLELQRVLTSHQPAEAGQADEPGEPGEPGEADELRFRVGVATGEALVDVAAAHDGGQAIVAGDVVNTAARIESVAPAGGVLVCGRTYALTRDTIRYAPAQSPVTLRGRTTPTEVWLALAPAPRQHTEPDATPLLEREHELGLLTGALHRAVQDRTPQLVTIFGSAGIGKSRLVHELRRRAQEPAPLVWRTGQCPPFGENATYAGLADIVKAEAGIRDNDSATTARRRLQQAVHDLASQEVIGPLEAERLVDALQPLVGLPGTTLPTEAAAEEAGSAWRRFLVALARRSPTVLVFEDLHWADEPMLRFIELLAATARDVPLLVLVTARPEVVERDASWVGAITGSLSITLPPLRPSSMATLCGHLLRPLLEGLRDSLVTLTDGNPLYAQEYVRMLVERGTGGSHPSATLAAAAAAEDPGEAAVLPVPDSVHAVIANRLDLLEPADRAVLQAAAVVGIQFWPGAVAAALGQPAALVERSLRRLEQRAFVAEQAGSTMAGHSELHFGHVLVRDVCYQRLPRADRIARHVRTADWLEAQSSHKDIELAEVLAHHRRAACEIARTLGLPSEQYAPAARQALYLAAQRAYALHALEAAASQITRALALLPPVDAREAKDTAQERLRLELFAAEIAFYRDRTGFLAGDGPDRLLELAQQLSAATSSPGPPRSASGEEPVLASDTARAWTLLGQVASLQADHPDARDRLSRAVALFHPLPDSPEKVDAYGELAKLHMLNYECEPAVAAAGTAAAIAHRLGLVEAHAHAQITIAVARYESGDPAGLDQLREVTDHCRTRQLLALHRAVRNLSALVREEGDMPQSEELLAESSRLDGPGSHNILIDHTDEVMRAYFTGDLDAIADSDSLAREAGSQWSDLRALRACVRALRGEPPVPDEVAGAVAAARAGGFRRELWYELAQAARCRALQGRPAEAAELLTELTGQWQQVAVIASGAWVGTAALAAALTGPEPSEALRVPLAAMARRTPWAEAALHTVSGAVALASGDPTEAGRRHRAAADQYTQIPAVTDRMLALALAAAALRRAGQPDQAESTLGEVRAFAQRCSAPGLLRLAERAG